MRIFRWNGHRQREIGEDKQRPAAAAARTRLFTQIIQDVGAYAQQDARIINETM